VGVSTEESQSIHRRLQASEPDAPSDLFTLFLDPLVDALRSAFPGLRDPYLVQDVVTDSLFKLAQEPMRYAPEKASLWRYLYTDAKGDLLNAIERERKRWKDATFDIVKHDVHDRGTNVEAEVLNALVPDGLPAGMALEEVLAMVRETISDPQDRELLKLMLHGERKSGAFSQVLGIENMMPLEQRRIIKQRKDRIDARLRRLGERIRSEHAIRRV
jgi:RNA polymerase sigma-70 factor (ECF subfamily)